MPIVDFSRSLSFRVIRSGAPYVTRGDEPEIERARRAGVARGVGPSVLLPFDASTDVEGPVGLVWARGRRDDRLGLDPTLARSFLELAALAVRVSRMDDTPGRVSTLEDRSRIARDLHDRVLRRLFDLGLALGAEEPRLSAPAGPAACEAVVTLDRRLTLRVSDNGRGLPAAYSESGLRNLRERARGHAGTLSVASGPGGCVLEWSVPHASGFVG